MPEWIKKLAEEKKQREEEAERLSSESREIQLIIPYVVKELISDLELVVKELNMEFHNGIKIYEVSDNMGYFNRFEDDFVVMTQSYPAAYLFVKVDGYQRVLTRKLQTIEHPQASRTEKVLPELKIGVDVSGNPVFINENKMIDKDEVTRLLVEPVYRFHTQS
jgi:hypothetical protein